MSPRCAPWVLVMVAGVSVPSAAQAEGGGPPVEVGLRHLGGRWYVLEGAFTAADLERLGIESRMVRQNAAPSERGKSFQEGLLLYKGEKLIDPFSENYGDTNGDGTQDLVVTYASDFITVRTQDLPNHPTGTFPNVNNPNSIQVQNMTFRIPVTPVMASQPIAVPLGPIGVALNGVVLYNQFAMGGTVAVQGSGEEWFDSCCGHPDQAGVYHYHKYPRCVKSPFTDRGTEHSPIVGYSWDGYAVYGPYESDGVLARDLTGGSALDICNGHTDATRGYHYHVTPNELPYLIGGYRGIPERSNNQNINLSNTTITTGTVTGADRYSGTVLTGVLPSQVSAGETVTMQLTLTTAGAQPPVPNSTPLVVNIGPYVGTNITRNGSTVTASITVPSTAALSLFDAHIEFAPPMGTLRPVYRKSDAVLVLSQEAKSAAWRVY